MEPKRVGVGVIGCGNISDIYFRNCRSFDNLEVRACADLLPNRAKEKATEHNIPKACSVDKLLADKDIDIVINLTIPKAHAEVAFKALEADKNVYNEKPLAISREDALKLVEMAKSRNLLLGGAPDTFLGAGLQTCRKLIDDGWIGTPVSSVAFMLCHGHESWHPDPEFYYKAGGGPMFDMGPYYLTALVSLIGPVRRVCGSARITFPERKITSEPKAGEIIKVETPTHIAGVIDFANGAIGTIVTSFDVWAHNLPHIEIHGTAGSLLVPDPNCFGGPVRIRRAGSEQWVEIPLTHGFAENSRGLGVSDMARALRSGRRHRANEALTYHVLDIMHAFHESSADGRHVILTSGCEQPEPFPVNIPPNSLDF